MKCTIAIASERTRSTFLHYKGPFWAMKTWLPSTLSTSWGRPSWGSWLISLILLFTCDLHASRSLAILASSFTFECFGASSSIDPAG